MFEQELAVSVDEGLCGVAGRSPVLELADEALLRRQVNLSKDTKAFRDYVKQAFVDTLTLYLHGICCDIDVDTGPRQLPSRYLRKRLQTLRDMFPPPEGYAVFPEETAK